MASEWIGAALLAMAAPQSAGSVDVAMVGMEPQIAIVRAYARERGWPTICEGRSGEALVLRVRATGSSPDELGRLQIEGILPVSGQWFAESFDPSGSCDLPPVEGWASAPIHVLAFSAPDLTPRLVALAKSCGFTKAFDRMAAASDFPSPKTGRKGWSIIDAGEDVSSRIQPINCFALLQNRVVETRTQERR